MFQENQLYTYIYNNNMNNTYIHIFKNTYIYTQLNKHIEKKNR